MDKRIRVLLAGIAVGCCAVSSNGADTLSMDTMMCVGWQLHDTIMMDTAQANVKWHVRYLITEWNAMCGLGFKRIWCYQPEDLSAYTSLSFKYKGPSVAAKADSGFTVQISTSDAVQNEGLQAYALAPAADWTTVEIPLSYWKNQKTPALSGTNINSIVLGIAGNIAAATDSGDLWIDDIMFIKSDMVGIDARELSPHFERGAVDGSYAVAFDLQGNKLAQVPKGTSVLSTLRTMPGGVALVRYMHNGIQVAPTARFVTGVR